MIFTNGTIILKGPNIKKRKVNICVYGVIARFLLINIFYIFNSTARKRITPKTNRMMVKKREYRIRLKL